MENENEKQVRTISIVRTRKGYPALWEQGGGFTNTGEATVIANSDGSPKKPLYVRTGGHLACENHALLPIKEGDLVIKASRHRNEYSILTYRIVKIEKEQAELEAIASHHIWYDEKKKKYFNEDGEKALLLDAEWAAVDKSTDYHCREPYWVLGSGYLEWIHS